MNVKSDFLFFFGGGAPYLLNLNLAPTNYVYMSEWDSVSSERGVDRTYSRPV